MGCSLRAESVFFLDLFFYIYLAALGPSCGTWDCRHLLKHVGSNSIRIEPGPPALESRSPSCWTQRRQWHPIPVLLPGKCHGRRSLVGCSPWGLEESDMTERLHFHFSLACIGEGNGNPLQCSCLENPRDGGAWWAAVCGVAELDRTEAT